MELSKGICVLCSKLTKVIVPPQAENITDILLEILKNDIDASKVDKTDSTLKICPCCLHDILEVAEHKKKNYLFAENDLSCSVCQNDENLISIKDWAHFDTILQNINATRKTGCTVCLQCIKFLDVLNRIKVNFLKKYPRLKLTPPTKQNGEKGIKNIAAFPSKTHKRRQSTIFAELHSDEVPVYKMTNVKEALKHLEPLKYSNFNTDPCGGDIKLLQQVAYVQLSHLDPTSKVRPRGYMRQSNKSKISDSDSSRDTSPKQSFFRIRLKLNAPKTKGRKVIGGKVTKAKSKLESNNKKELIVKMIKMDLSQIKRESIKSDSDEEETQMKTPIKARQKIIVDDPLSSSKKRKNVTFAEDLDVDLVDGGFSRKDNLDGTPLRSLLKKYSSPTSQLLTNGSAENTSDEDSDAVNNIKTKYDNLGSDDEMDNSKSYVQEIQKNNDNIFDSLKADEPRNDIGKKETKKTRSLDSDSEVDEENISMKPSKKTGINSESENEDEINSDKDQGANTDKRGENVSDTEDDGNRNKASKESDFDNEDTSKSCKEVENGTDDKDSSSSAYCTTENMKEEILPITEAAENIDNKSIRKSRKKNPNDTEEGTSDLDAESTSSKSSENVTKVSTKEDNKSDEENDNRAFESSNETVKSKTMLSHFDSVSTCSDSSKEDTLVTLAEYKKIKKSVDGNDTGKNQDRENLKDLDEMKNNSESLENTDLNNENTSGKNSSVERTESKKRRISSVERLDEEENEEVALAKKSREDDFDEPETNRDKVSENEIDQNEIQTDASVENDTLLLPENPKIGNETNVTTNEPNVDIANTVSDSQHAGIGSEDTGPQLSESTVESQNTIDTVASLETNKRTNNAENVSDSVDIEKESGNVLISDVQTGDNVTLETSNLDSSQKSCSDTESSTGK